MNDIALDYRITFSKTTQQAYYMNHCEHCKAPIEDHFLYDSITSKMLKNQAWFQKGVSTKHQLPGPFYIPIDCCNEIQVC